MTLTVETGDAAGAGHIMEPLLSALRALTDTLHGPEGEGEDEGGEDVILVGADQTEVLSSVAPLTRLMFLSSRSLGHCKTGWCWVCCPQ